MRRCSNCGETTQPGFVSDTYTRKGVTIEVTVSGIPAELCLACGWNFTELETVREIESLVAPLFMGAPHLSRLPVPKIVIEFPALVTA